MGVIIRQSIKGTLVNYAGVAVGFVTTFFVITHYLTADEVGLTRVLVDAAMLFSNFAQMGTGSSIIRFYPYFKNEDKKDHGFFFWTILVPFVGFWIFLGIFFLLKNQIVGFFAEKSPLFVKYFKYIIPLSLFMLYQYVFESNANVLMRIVVPKFVREVGVRLCLLATYILYGLNVLSLDGLVVAFCITYFLAALVDIIYLFTLQKVSLRPDFKYITPQLRRNFLLYTAFLVVAAIAGNITPLLNSFFVSAKMGLVYTGIFAISNYIATVVEIPNRSLNAITQPNISAAVKDRDWVRTNSLCKSVSLHQMLSSSFLFLLIWFNIDLIFNILPNGAQYMAGKSVVFILGLSRLLSSTLGIAVSPLSYSKYYYMSLIFTVLLTSSAIALNIALIPRMGIDGAAIASLLAYLLYYVIMLVFMRYLLHINIFSRAQLKVLAVVAGMYAANLLCTVTLTKEVFRLFGMSLPVQIAEGALRTAAIVSLGAAATYYWKISGEVNGLIEKIFRRKHRA